MSSSNVTMAAFTNQVSNLSALTSAIGAFSRILEVSEEFDANETGKFRGRTKQRRVMPTISHRNTIFLRHRTIAS